jgi:hypothetical protein
MATTQMVGVVRHFTASEIARFVRKDLATVRKWFELVPGVRKYPRGYGKQKPSLAIPELIARAKLIDIGFSEAEILAGLVEPHDRRLREEAQTAEPTPPFRVSKHAGKSGKPRKIKAKEEPVKRVTAERRRRA